ncbi:AMP-binding protein [Amylibacter sp. IMCC11727]|uniref:AMP-binding protein n=1 Tax=Amylibacter sp. IMCC11727 TaxID=3039851 RepID=UPI00244D9A3A|nr:AMP-binding protein [Amylibacter sp. IMCC11727]WGI22482.1 AMP-binding protein [Amylibacter sp. IMCC11727]
MNQPWTKYFSEEAKNFDLANMGAQTFSALCDTAAEKYASKTALTTILPTGAEASISFTELKAEAEAFAVYLREVLKLNAGDTVAVMTPNCIGFGVACMGIAKAGCISTNVNPLYTAPELEHQLNDSSAKVLVIIDLFGDKVGEVVHKTGVETVVTMSLLEYFPGLKRAILGFVLKRVKKVIPDMRTSHVTLKSALAAGKAASGDVASYTADVSPDDVALYQYTSGTTGRSKGAELSHRSVIANAYQAELMTEDLMSGQGETVLVILPLYHITAFSLIFIAGLRTGAHSVLVPSPRPPSNLKAAFEKHKITWFTGINTLYAALLVEDWAKKELFENVRFCGSGGAAQTTGVAMKWEEKMGVPIRQGWGMTECCGVMTFNPSEDNRLGSVGVPVPGMDVRIVDDNGNDVSNGEPGEVIGRGPTIMKGYINRPDATAETIVDGWLHSGDIGVMDADGYIEIVDRKKDMILVSGFNVAPNEVEDTISTMEGVVQVGVVGYPDDKTGEAVAAFVVRADDSVTEETVRMTCKAGLTNYKVPKRVEFVDEVPVTLSGKVLRRELRDTYLG